MLQRLTTAMFGLALLAMAGHAAPAKAAPITYGFGGGSFDFGSPPNVATATGTFSFDPASNLVTDIAIFVTGAGALDGNYTVPVPLLLVTGDAQFRALSDGTDPASDLTGMPVFNVVLAMGSFADGGALDLFEVGMFICGTADCNAFSATAFLTSLVAGDTFAGTIIEQVAPIPAPPAAPLLAMAIGAFAWLRRRRPPMRAAHR